MCAEKQEFVKKDYPLTTGASMNILSRKSGAMIMGYGLKKREVVIYGQKRRNSPDFTF